MPGCRAKAPQGVRRRFVVLREFVVAPGREEEFEAVFGRNGEWQQLLSGSAGSIATGLQEFSDAYRLRDLWDSHWDFESFRRRKHDDCEALSHEMREQGVIESETWLGAFYEDWPDDDAGDDLILT